MKICIVGTSNSILGLKGYIQALRLEHNVTVILTGRVPFYFHLKSIEMNKDLIESCDLLILDHYINDQFYVHELDQSYTKHYEIFYKYLTSLNVRILDLMFPFKDIFKKITKQHYAFTLTNLNKNNISVINLNNLNFDDSHYQDMMHLNQMTSYLLGVFLNKELSQINLGEKPTGGMCSSNPFDIVEAAQITTNNKLKTFENSLLKINYIDVIDKITLKRQKSSRLIAIGYAKPKENAQFQSACKINGHSYGLTETGCFTETINTQIYGDITIEAVFEKNTEIPNLMGREGSSVGEFNYLYLTDLIFYDEDAKLEIIAAKRELLQFNMDKFIIFCKKIFHMSNQQRNI